jgi:2-dehydropantoate 2-reductase
MQFAVIGAGNIGCLYGGNLARIGEQVTLIDIWEEHIDQIRAHGLQMDGLHGAFTVSLGATTDPAGAPKADVALICVNSYATEVAAYSARMVLKDSGYALTLQNGLGNIEILSQVLGEGVVMAGLTFHSADTSGPGKVSHTNHGPTYLGELDGSRSPRLLALREILDRAGMNPVLEEDIMAIIWGKFVHNCGINAICAITDLRPGHIREVPAVDEFQTQIINEILALVKAKGITLPDSNPLETIKAYCAKKFHRVSMVQHLERGQLTEIDALNGFAVRESKQLGLSAPYNDALTKLIKGLQHRPENNLPGGV